MEVDKLTEMATRYFLGGCTNGLRRVPTMTISAWKSARNVVMNLVVLYSPGTSSPAFGFGFGTRLVLVCLLSTANEPLVIDNVQAY